MVLTETEAVSGGEAILRGIAALGLEEDFVGEVGSEGDRGGLKGMSEFHPVAVAEAKGVVGKKTQLEAISVFELNGSKLGQKLDLGHEPNFGGASDLFLDALKITRPEPFEDPIVESEGGVKEAVIAGVVEKAILRGPAQRELFVGKGVGILQLRPNLEVRLRCL